MSAGAAGNELRRSNLRVGLYVVGFMLFLYAVSVVGVLVLN